MIALFVPGLVVEAGAALSHLCGMRLPEKPSRVWVWPAWIDDVATREHGFLA